MAILKFITRVCDFDSITAFLDTGSVYTDASRVEYGYFFNVDEQLSASWPEPVGNTVWIHWRHGQTSINVSWDDFGVPRFYDSNGTEVLRMDITNGLIQWELFGDTSPAGSYAAVAGSGLIYDVQFTKNGTTDLTVNIYVDGVLKLNLTAANAANKGVPVSFNTTHQDSATQGTQYFSEGIIADEDTRGWRLREHQVTSFGVDQDWAGDANAIADQNYATGLRSNTLDQRVSFGVAKQADIPIGVVVDRVVLASALQRGATGLASFNHYWRYDDGIPTISDSADVALALDARIYINEYTTSPKSGVAWTQAELVGMQPGVRART